MYSILHISDLHRTPNADISNAELLSALVRDRDSYIKEEVPIRSPDAIVVSGDVVQGVKLGTPNGKAALEAQYIEAEKFLKALADEFVGGERSRVIIVPGNHDINWQIARDAMSLVGAQDIPKRLPSALQQPGGPYRWSWDTRELFKITDYELYNERLQSFWKFFSSFYDGEQNLLRVVPGSDANIYSLHDGRIGVAAFNSCHGNDCFAFHGHIPSELISQTHLDMRELGPFELALAVWHHNLEGPPYRSDYMDIEVVRAMIGRNFRIGLYGHQHRAQASAQSLGLATSETMALLGTGALCAGGSELPDGTHRQYSIVEIHDDLQSAKVHVREVADADLFAPANRVRPVTIGWGPPTDLVGQPIDAKKMAGEGAVSAAERLLKSDSPQQALDELWPIRNSLEGYGRKLIIDSALQAKDWSRLNELTTDPATITEFVAGVEGRKRTLSSQDSLSFIAQHCERVSLPPQQRQELEREIAISERLKQK
jgi:hypothetical protein